MKNMNDWSTDFSNLPEEGRVIVTQVNAGWSVGMASVELIRLHPDKFKAWQPIPEPYAPPKPEQISADDPLFPYTEPRELIRQIEQRTREIVAWEQEHGDDE